MSDDPKYVTYTKEDLERMPPKQRNEVFLKAVKMTGVAVVTGPDGKPKYDDPSLAGTYHEEQR